MSSLSPKQLFLKTLHKLKIDHIERKSTLELPYDGELQENPEGPFTTHVFVINSAKKLEPKCIMCADRGNMFVFDGPKKALVYCSAKCQTDHEMSGRIGEDTHDIILLDTERIVWLSLALLISVLGFCMLTRPWLQSAGSSFLSLFQKLLLGQ